MTQIKLERKHFILVGCICIGLGLATGVVVKKL